MRGAKSGERLEVTELPLRVEEYTEDGCSGASEELEGADGGQRCVFPSLFPQIRL